MTSTALPGMAIRLGAKTVVGGTTGDITHVTLRSDGAKYESFVSDWLT